MIVRFALTGLISTLTHILLAWVALDRLQAPPALANGLAFLHANTLAYLINTRWTFRTGNSLATWRRYLAVSLMGGVASTGISGGVAALGGDEFLGILLVVCSLPIVNFYAHRHYTYA